jgi:hypothetical protein
VGARVERIEIKWGLPSAGLGEKRVVRLGE